MLQSVKALANAELKAGKLSREMVLKNYEDVRKGIVKELQRKHPDLPNDYEAIK
jgi:hypothetical protein